MIHNLQVTITTSTFTMNIGSYNWYSLGAPTNGQSEQLSMERFNDDEEAPARYLKSPPGSWNSKYIRFPSEPPDFGHWNSNSYGV